MCIARLLRPWALAALLLTAACALPGAARAQSARGTVTASATVVEPLSLASAAPSLSAARGAVDLSAPLSIGGRVAHVLQVTENGRALPARITPKARPAEGVERDYQLRVRLASSGDTAARELAYVVSTVN